VTGDAYATSSVHVIETQTDSCMDESQSPPDRRPAQETACGRARRRFLLAVADELSCRNQIRQRFAYAARVLVVGDGRRAPGTS
jgi:hypothetical protein